MIPLLRRLVSTAAALSVLCACVVLGASPASATVTTLCTGYAACAEAGMSSAGYGRANDDMYWRMYSGHNCTNYAAYRMVRSGLANERPWSGSGNATNWGEAMAGITDATPRVGSVAWWRAGVYPAGSAGHVAYVEEVVSADEIIISQDSWGGEFSWARVTRGSRGWPTGFIHFNDVPLRNTARPAIGGEPRVGAELTTTPGAWRPRDVTAAYQWRAGGTDLRGATGPTFTVPRGLIGERITVRVTVSEPGYPSASATSLPTGVVEPGILSAASPPSVDGEPRVDGTLTASAGAWEPMPHSVTYQWLADGDPVRGAEGQSLDVVPALVGKALTVRVTAHRRGYADVAVTSTPTAAVEPGILSLLDEPALTGTPRLGEVLEVETGSVSADAEASVRWYRGGVRVRGATGISYELTPADLGERIRARVRWTRPGYSPLAVRTASTWRAKALPDLDVAVQPRSRGLAVDATVTAVGLEQVSGVLRVRTGGGVVIETAFTDGRASLDVRGLRPGTRTVRVVVAPSETVARAVVEREVTIR